MTMRSMSAVRLHCLVALMACSLVALVLEALLMFQMSTLVGLVGGSMNSLPEALVSTC